MSKLNTLAGKEPKSLIGESVGDLPLKKPKLVCDSFKYHSS